MSPLVASAFFSDWWPLGAVRLSIMAGIDLDKPGQDALATGIAIRAKQFL
jgi:hypothetical protein